MYRLLCLKASLVLALVCPLAAHADNISTFNIVDATFASGATGSGTITINTTTGTYVGLDFTYQLGATILVFDTISGQSAFNSQYYFYSFNADGDLLDLGVPGADLVGYGGGSICTAQNPPGCGGDAGYVVPSGGTVDFEATGSLVAAPEPSSILLFGTGAVFVINTARRRAAQS